MPRMRNPITSVLLWPLSLIACTIAVVAPGDPVALGCGVGVVFLIYVLIYRRVALLSRLRRALFEQLAQRA